MAHQTVLAKVVKLVNLAFDAVCHFHSLSPITPGKAKVYQFIAITFRNGVIFKFVFGYRFYVNENRLRIGLVKIGCLFVCVCVGGGGVRGGESAN